MCIHSVSQSFCFHCITLSFCVGWFILSLSYLFKHYLQALLYPSLTRCCLQILDLSGLQCENGKVEDSMGGWSLSVALCSMVLQARSAGSRAHRRDGDRERKRGLEAERDRGTIKRDWGKVGCGNSGEGSQRGHGVEEVEQMECRTNERMFPGDESVKGVRRRMEIQRRKTLSEGKSNTSSNNSHLCDQDWDEVVMVHVRADLFVNSRSWERVRDALSQPGPLRLHCRYLRVEELLAPSIASLLGLLPQQDLLGVDFRYSSLGVSGLAMLLPLLAPFPQLHSLRLHYCNLDLQRTQPGQQGALQDMSKGLGSLKRLKRLCLTALRLPGHLRLLLRYIHTRRLNSCVYQVHSYTPTTHTLWVRSINLLNKKCN